jgi:hypothetical protein
MSSASAAAPVFVIDDLTSKPGCGEALLTAYLERYVPGARTRGMTLVQQLVSPPYWRADAANRLLFVWRVEGAAGAWRMKHMGRQDPTLAAWWSEEAPALLSSRSRAICAEPAALAELADV